MHSMPLIVSARESRNRYMLLRLEMLRFRSYEVDDFVKVRDNSGSVLDRHFSFFFFADEFRNDTTT